MGRADDINRAVYHVREMRIVGSAGELARCGANYTDAFQRYESLLRPFLAAKQRGTQKFASAFVPITGVGFILRNVLIAATAIPGFARFAFGRDITDQMTLPEYPWC